MDVFNEFPKDDGKPFEETDDTRISDWKEGEKEEEIHDISQDQDNQSCSSGSSTVLSESTPHWADFFEPDPWADEFKPPFKLLECEDFVYDDDEAEGILSDRMINSGLSFTSHCPILNNYSLNKLQLPGKNISHISKIADYRYLQYVDLSRNDLRVISPLGNLPFLMYLDVSFNKLAFLLQFAAPLNLTYVNFSHNEVSFIDDLTDFWSLVRLDLSYNNISKIEGLRNLRYLRVLDLSFNEIKRIENLNYLRLTHLYLQNNKISEFEEGEGYGTKTLQCLQTVNLDNNELNSLSLFEDSPSLLNVSLKGNHIQEIFEIENLKASVSLKELNFVDNSVTAWPEYRGMVISTVPSLVILDRIPVTSEEKALARNTFDPDTRFVAARNYSLLTIIEQLNNPVIDPYTPPVDEPPLPIIILVGPVGSGKGYLTRYIAEKFPGKISLGVCHTSRPKSSEEIDAYHYYFVDKDKMNELIYTGAFVAYSEILGNYIGLDQNELIKAFKKKCLCISSFDLVGATAIYNRGIKLHLVLTIPQSEEVHLQRLLEKPYISQRCKQEECQNKVTKDNLIRSTIASVERLFTESFLKSASEGESQMQIQDEELKKARTIENIAIMVAESMLDKVILCELEKEKKKELIRSNSIDFIAQIIADALQKVPDSEPPENLTCTTDETKQTLARNTFYFIQSLIEESFPKLLKKRDGEEEQEEEEEEEEEEKEEDTVKFIHSLLENSFLKNISESQRSVENDVEKYIQNAIKDSFLKYLSKKSGKKSCHCLSEENASIDEETSHTQLEENNFQIQNPSIEYMHTLFTDPLTKKVEKTLKSTPHSSIDEEKEVISDLLTDIEDYSALSAILKQKPESKQFRAQENAYKPPKKKKTCLECDYAKLSIKVTLESRETYFKLCDQNKDFFSSVLYTDDLNEACQLLSETVKQVYQTMSHEAPLFSEEHEKFKASVPNRLNYFMAEINKHHHIYEEEKS